MITGSLETPDTHHSRKYMASLPFHRPMGTEKKKPASLRVPVSVCDNKLPPAQTLLHVLVNTPLKNGHLMSTHQLTVHLEMVPTKLTAIILQRNCFSSFN